MIDLNHFQPVMVLSNKLHFPTFPHLHFHIFIFIQRKRASLWRVLGWSSRFHFSYNTFTILHISKNVNYNYFKRARTFSLPNKEIASGRSGP
jgi:hypothetical protein